MSPEAEEIWNLSEQYVALAPEHLDPARVKITRPIKTSDREQMRAAFLFPTVQRDTQTYIGIIRQMRLGAEQQLERGKESPNDPRQSAEHTEASADEAAAELKAIINELTPTQREILREHYFVSDC